MYRYSFRCELERWSISTLRLLGAVLIALQLVLSSAAFASSTQSSYSFGSSQPIDQASVSVVRLIVSYAATSAQSGCQSSSFTGLGVLVGSWATSAGSTTINNWVLTDGSLVNPNGLTCGQSNLNEPITTIQIYTSTAYAGSTTGPTSVQSVHPLVSMQCQGQTCNGERIVCQITPNCANGVVLVPFQTTAPEPFIDVATTDQANPIGIELTR